MKFAKVLQDEVVPEWRKAYIDYKQGKKYLKKIEDAIADYETAQDQSEADHHISSEPAAAARMKALRLANDPSTSNILGGTMTSEPDSDYPERPAPVYSPDLSPESPTGTTPIIGQGRPRVKSYDTIQSAESLQSVTHLLSTTLNMPDGDQSERNSTLRGVQGVLRQQPLHQHQSQFQSGNIKPTKSGHSGRLDAGAEPQHPTLFRTLTRKFTINNISEHPRRSRVIHVAEGDTIESVMAQLLPEEVDFFEFLDGQLKTVDIFYREKETEAVAKLKVLKQQIYVADEWKRQYDEKIAKVQEERSWYQAEWSRVRHGIGNLMGDASFDQADVTLGPANHANHTGSDASSSTTGSNTYPGQEIRQRQARGPVKYGQDSRKSPLEQAAFHNQWILEDAEHRRQHLNHKVARTRIKAAMYEFYRSLEMLKNYKVLNNTGFVKIMKKYDKTAGWKASKLYIPSKLNTAYFMTSTELNDLITETEDLFIEKFENGQRRRGMAKLRIPDSKGQSQHSATARAGIYLGLSIPLLVLGIQGALSKNRQAQIPYWDSLLLIYGGLFLTILFACLFGINMYAWSKARINYKFIFEFDPRDNLDFHQFFELPMFFMLLLCMALYFDFGWDDTAHIPIGYYYPLIVMSVVLAILLCPLPVANWGARRWFLQSIGRILVSGYYRIEFRDFFIADEMNSLAYSIEQFEFAVCAYSEEWHDVVPTCTTSQLWLTPFLTAIPAWFRFLQCLRRFRDTLEWYPHLINSGKYFMTLVQLFVYFTYRHYTSPRTKAAFIVISLITSSYTYSWDVYMDWGLFRFGKHGGGAYGQPLLRQELVYSRKWVYYMAIVLDFVGRFAWMTRLIPTSLNPLVLSFILALIEILRRWMWNFFRLENEHLNNCGQFRAIKDIPLPFHIRVEGESEEEEEEEQEGEEQEGEEQLKLDVERPDIHKFDSGDITMAEGGSSDLLATDAIKKPQRSLARSATISSGGSLANLGSAGPARTSRVSLRSATSVIGSHRSGLRKRGSQLPEPPFNIQRSNTFVHNAMAEAGFEDDRRERLTAINKFYDRRDFDSKIIETPAEGMFTQKSRSSTGTLSIMRGLGIDAQDGAKVGNGTTKRAPKRRGSKILGWMKNTDEEDTDEDD